MITVTRYIDGVPALVVRSSDETAEKLPAAWHNGDHVHLSIAGFEIAMPPQTWERVWREVRHVLEHPPAAPEPLSVTGKNAEHVQALTDPPEPIETTTFDDRIRGVRSFTAGGQVFTMPDPYTPKAGS